MQITAIFQRVVKLIRCLPFSIGMIIILCLVAWWTNSYFYELTEIWVSRLGFAPRDFWFFRWERLILSALVTSGGISFWFALGMVAFTSGVAEWVTTSLRAALTFWGVHLVTLATQIAIVSVAPAPAWIYTGTGTLLFTRCRAISRVHGQPGIDHNFFTQTLAVGSFRSHTIIPDCSVIHSACSWRNQSCKIVS